MKRLISCLLVFVMVLSCFSAVAAEDKVEIIFKVGDSTLLINGSQVTVEKPYVVGEGVTLVPIRVITEAFGAKVDWIAETKTVKLSYPDVEIVIQIDNPMAEVNGRAEKLLAPPELTASGFTMIPLRFISENFGAVVSYDDATGGISVVKEVSDGDIVSAGVSVDSKYIGDSFYGWSMQNPVGMTMDDRSFDGRGTFFVDGENKISIEILTYDPEEYDFEKEYNEIKLSSSKFTLVNAEKNTDDENCKWMRFGLKDSEVYGDYQHFVTPENIYIVTGVFPHEDAKARDEYLEILSTFKCSFEGDDVHDLSNIKDGFRRFESEQLKFSFDVPENYYMASSSSQNRFDFFEVKNEVSSITSVVYSKSDVTSARELATEDYNHNKKVMNEKLATFSDNVTDKQYNGLSAWEYTYSIESFGRKEHTRDVFFEVGDYVYNVSVTVEIPMDDRDGYIDRIINSIKAEPLDSKEVGVLMKNVPVATGTFDVTAGDATIKLPNIYKEVLSSETTHLYMGALNGMGVSLTADNTCSSLGELKESFRNIEGLTDKNPSSSVIKDTQPLRMKNANGFETVIYVTEDDAASYCEYYGFVYEDVAYVISFVCPDYSYSESAKKEIKEILNSLTFDE